MANPQNSRATPHKRGQCAKHEHRPIPPEKDQNVQTEHLGMARSSRGVFPNGCLQGFSDAWRAYPAKASSFRMHGARILPRIGDFPVRGPLGDAWSAKLATDRYPGTHRARILPPSDAEERISRAFCHRRAPENAPWQHLATAAPSRMLLDGILPRRPWAARPCCEIAAAPRSRKTPPERSVGQFNNARRHVQETMKIFWCLSPRNGTENVLA